VCRCEDLLVRREGNEHGFGECHRVGRIAGSCLYDRKYNRGRAKSGKQIYRSYRTLLVGMCPDLVPAAQTVCRSRFFQFHFCLEFLPVKKWLPRKVNHIIEFSTARATFSAQNLSEMKNFRKRMKLFSILPLFFLFPISQRITGTSSSNFFCKT
jgi:hypothetical protein